MHLKTLYIDNSIIKDFIVFLWAIIVVICAVYVQSLDVDRAG